LFCSIKQPSHNFLSQSEITSLKYQHRITKEKRIADNFKIILYLNKGLSYKEVAELLFLDENTIHNVYERYVEAGITGISAFKYIG